MPKRPIPFEFVVEAIETRSPWVRPMFGCFSVYVGDEIVLFLRERDDEIHTNGVWVATTPAHRESLAAEFFITRQTLREGEFGSKWLRLPSDHPRFEQDALRACELIVARDPRVGHPPSPRKSERKAGGSRPTPGR